MKKAKIMIKDLPSNLKVSEKEMKHIKGGLMFNPAANFSFRRARLDPGRLKIPGGLADMCCP